MQGKKGLMQNVCVSVTGGSIGSISWSLRHSFNSRVKAWGFTTGVSEGLQPCMDLLSLLSGQM